MKRAHKTTHLLIWIILAPVILAALWFAITHQPIDPVNETLPQLLNEAAS